MSTFCTGIPFFRFPKSKNKITAVANAKISATVTSIDVENGFATVTTDYCEGVKVPLSILGIPTDAKAEDYAGVPAILSIHTPVSTFFDTYNDDGEGIYLAKVNEIFDGKPVNPISQLNSIDMLNKDAENGSHENDNYMSAYLESNSREEVVLNSLVNGYTRYDNGWYPRVSKVSDDMYLLTYMYGQFGVHLYYVTSSDGINWNPPQVLWNQAHYPAFTYEFKGTIKN